MQRSPVHLQSEGLCCVCLPSRDEGPLHTSKVFSHFPGSASLLQLVSSL